MEKNNAFRQQQIRFDSGIGKRVLDMRNSRQSDTMCNRSCRCAFDDRIFEVAYKHSETGDDWIKCCINHHCGRIHNVAGVFQPAAWKTFEK